MTTIFDLDYTLLDSDKLKNKLAEIMGIEKNEYRKSYKQLFTEKGISYSLERHLDYYKEIDKEDVLGRFNEINSIENLLYNGAVALLETEINKGNKIVLITFGNEDWQKKKIEKLKVLKEKFGDNIKFESAKKSESRFFREIALEGDDIVIYNDKVGETENMTDEIRRIREKNGMEQKTLRGIIVELKEPEGEGSSEQKARDNGFGYYQSLLDLNKESEHIIEEIWRNERMAG